MSETEIERIDRNKLPWYYKLILKIPGANYLGSYSGGIFWGIIVPIFMILEFFLSMVWLVYFSFPLNLFAASIIPTMVLLVFTRINIERYLSQMDALTGSTPAVNVEDKVQEYLEYIDKKKKRK